MTPATISTTFLVLSDTHGFDFERDNGASPLRLPLPKVDVVLHCGDLTRVGGKSEFRKALRMLGHTNAGLKLVIAGNHDLELDPAYDPDKPGDHVEALSLFTGPEAAAAGVTYLEEGTHTFVLSNGARFTVYASPYQPEYGDWAFSYKRHEDRYNLSKGVLQGATSIAENPVPATVDIIMTHGPPRGILDGNLGCRNLLQAVRRARPLMHCFGHIHEGYGTEVMHRSDGFTQTKSISITQVNGDTGTRFYHMNAGQDTLMVNAALQTGPLEWKNAPWLVALPLPIA